MRNNGGWGLQIMLVFCAILILGLVISFSMIQRQFSSLLPKEDTPISSSSYSDLEVALVNSTKRYIHANYQTMLEDPEDLRVVVSLLQLKKEGFQGSLKDPKTKEECNGYVIFQKIENHYQYNAYIRCGNNYETNGYEEVYENA